MSSSPSSQSWGISDVWGMENPATAFSSRSAKSRLFISRRSIVLLVTVLIMVTLSVCLFTTWILPSPRHSKPWQLKTSKTCERSILGKDIVADEFGYTCQWQDSWMQPSGCCDQTSSTSSRYSCATCDASMGCCGVYEQCVSCCLKEDNLKDHFESDRMKQLAKKDKEVFTTLQDPFELCQTVCRTSSQSLDNIDGSTVFRSESLKYCYNTPTYSTPAIRLEQSKIEVNEAKIAKRANREGNEGNTREQVGETQNTQQVTVKQTTDANIFETASATKIRTDRALKATKEFIKNTKSFISAAASTYTSGFVLSYYILLFLVSIAFFHY